MSSHPNKVAIYLSKSINVHKSPPSYWQFWPKKTWSSQKSRIRGVTWISRNVTLTLTYLLSVGRASNTPQPSMWSKVFMAGTETRSSRWWSRQTCRYSSMKCSRASGFPFKDFRYSNSDADENFTWKNGIKFLTHLTARSVLADHQYKWMYSSIPFYIRYSHFISEQIKEPFMYQNMCGRACILNIVHIIRYKMLRFGNVYVTITRIVFTFFSGFMAVKSKFITSTLVWWMVTKDKTCMSCI